MASVEERLALLEAEREILKTLHTYGHTLDHDLEEEFVDCWVENAVLHWPDPPFPEPFRGRAGIREAFRGHTHAPAVYHKHIVVDPRIEIDGETATVESYYTRLDDGPNGPYIFSFGRYRDVLTRCDDGRWRFSERRALKEAKVGEYSGTAGSSS
jgi:ketosteroid isomerase-like protein